MNTLFVNVATVRIASNWYQQKRKVLAVDLTAVIEGTTTEQSVRRMTGILYCEDTLTFLCTRSSHLISRAFAQCDAKLDSSTNVRWAGRCELMRTCTFATPTGFSISHIQAGSRCGWASTNDWGKRQERSVSDITC